MPKSPRPSKNSGECVARRSFLGGAGRERPNAKGLQWVPPPAFFPLRVTVYAVG